MRAPETTVVVPHGSDYRDSQLGITIVTPVRVTVTFANFHPLAIIIIIARPLEVYTAVILLHMHVLLFIHCYLIQKQTRIVEHIIMHTKDIPILSLQH